MKLKATNQMNKLIITLITIACCFSIAVYAGDDEFLEKVYASGVIDEQESVLLHSNVYFYPNKKGHGIFSGSKKREKGHIIFTENGYSVISWSRRAKAYEVLHSEIYSELESSDISGNSPMIRLVTETKASGKYNSFELMDSRNALTPNVNKTKEAKKIVSAGIQGLDVTEVATAKNLSAAEVAMQQKKMQDLEERIQRLENVNAPAENDGCDCKCEK